MTEKQECTFHSHFHISLSLLKQKPTNFVVVFALLLFVISFLLSCTLPRATFILSFFLFFSYLKQDEVFTMRKILYYLKMRLFHHKRCCLLWDEPVLQRAILTKVKDFWTVKFPHIFYQIDFRPFQKFVYAKLIISSNTHKHTHRHHSPNHINIKLITK